MIITKGCCAAKGGESMGKSKTGEKRPGRHAALKYFFITLCVSSAVLGGLAALALHILQPGSLGDSPFPSAPADTFYLPQDKDDINLLLIGSSQKGDEPVFYTLIRLDATGGKIPIASFPAQTVALREGKPVTLSEAWQAGGPQGAAAALGEGPGIPVQRYAAYDRESFITAVDRIGTMELLLEYTLDHSDSEGKISLERGRQLVDGVKFFDLMRCPAYPGGEQNRCNVTSRLFASYLNQKLDTVLSTQADLVFETIVNSVETNISAADYHDRKGALVFMAKLGGSPAVDIPLEGSFNQSGDSFGLTEHAKAALGTAFGGENLSGESSAP